jgi:hypothetical protein
VGDLLTLRQDLCQALRTQNIPAYIAELFRNSRITNFQATRMERMLMFFTDLSFSKSGKITLSTKTIENDICAFFQKAPVLDVSRKNTLQ